MPGNAVVQVKGAAARKLQGKRPGATGASANGSGTMTSTPPMVDQDPFLSCAPRGAAVLVQLGQCLQPLRVSP